MKTKYYVLSVMILFTSLMALVQCGTHEKTRTQEEEAGNPDAWNSAVNDNARDMMSKGKAVFRYETFGDEVFWTDKLQLHKSIADSKHGGNGEGLTPKAALAAGLKVDLTR